MNHRSQHATQKDAPLARTASPTPSLLYWLHLLARGATAWPVAPMSLVLPQISRHYLPATATASAVSTIWRVKTGYLSDVVFTSVSKSTQRALRTLKTRHELLLLLHRLHARSAKWLRRSDRVVVCAPTNGPFATTTYGCSLEVLAPRLLSRRWHREATRLSSLRTRYGVSASSGAAARATCTTHIQEGKAVLSPPTIDLLDCL
jgi:hypothetical protein